jgi:tetratricopeptide (TPR) repeat protein
MAKMKQRHFSQLKKSWGLAEDTSLEDLLSYAQSKLKDDPENPELLFNIAELMRHTEHTEEAKTYYQESIKSTDKRTSQRGEALESRIEKKRDHTRAKFIFLTFAPLFALIIGGTLFWKQLNKPEVLPADSNPEKFAFTEWLAKQQMVEIMTTLQQENPELTFDFNRSAGSQTPMEFMQSLMQPDALEKLRRDRERAANQQNNTGPGRPAFQCSKEPAVSCAAKDIPSAPGERREEVVQLMEAYNTILDSELDCEKIEKSIDTIGQQLQWRKSERRIKANLEDLAVECFYKQKNVEKTIEHSRKLQCTGDEGYINSVYWFLTAITHHAGDKASSLSSYQCFQEATDYVGKQDFSAAYVASRHRESGALAWLYFDDLETATAELERGRTILKNAPKQTAATREVIAEIDLDLLETYVTANIDLDSFNDLMEEINSSGLLTDGYKQIKDTLASIYYMQNKDDENAIIALNNLSSRFKLMPEFICGWDWSGFRRGLEDSIADNDIRDRARNLVDAANCYVKQSMPERIQVINDVSGWLKRQ